MNPDKIHELAGDFFARFPDGFSDPEMLKVRKKHNVDKLVEQAKTLFDPSQFGNPEVITQSMTQLVSRSSMVSMFEKPRFRDAVGSSLPETREILSDGLSELLHGDEEKGFNAILDELVTMKLAKWSLMSILPFYYAPTECWFIKPNTTKAILRYFEAGDELVYKPRPSYEFYRDYGVFLDELKGRTDERLSPSNAAFTGFLMMSLM